MPTTFVSCVKDNAVPLFLQDIMIERVKARGIEVNVEKVDSGHSVMLSQPDQLLNIIQKMTV